MSQALPPSPPSVVDTHGLPRFGTYQGPLPSVDLGALRDPFAAPEPLRFFMHKRWVYSLIATPEVMVGFGILDVGYSSLGFAIAVDLLERKVLSDDGFLGPPRPLSFVGDSPARGLASRFRTLGASLSLTRALDAERVVAQAEILGLRARHRSPLKLRAEILAEGGAPPLSVIAPVKQGFVNTTQKHAGLLSFGTLLAGGRTYGLDGGVAGVDYSQGLVARHTKWKWAMAVGRLPDGTPVGLNLIEGFNEGEGANENAVWLGNKLIPLAPARFDLNPSDPLETWRLSTVDGALSLEFRPFHVHRELRDLKLVKSHFQQPLGHFSGTLTLDGKVTRLERLAGVTELQDATW